MNINEMSMDQLKAMAYDNYITMQQCQLNIQTLNAEILKREQQPKDAKPKVAKVKNDSIN